MSVEKDLQCEYLAADRSSCTAVAEGEGKAARSQDCSSRKNLCCYLCYKRESCEISCTFLDQAPAGRGQGSKQMSFVVSPNGEEKALICPICGAPYRTLIPAGVVQVKCAYCGASVLVLPHLGGGDHQCPNHPDIFAVGICNDCGHSFCDRCLYIQEVRDGTLYVCADCCKSRRQSGFMGLGIIAGLPLIMVFVALIAATRPESTSESLSGLIILMFFGILLFLGIVVGALFYFRKQPVSIHDARTQLVSSESPFRREHTEA